MAATVKKIPQRQCMGCGEIKNKKDLIRVIKTAGCQEDLAVFAVEVLKIILVAKQQAVIFINEKLCEVGAFGKEYSVVPRASCGRICPHRRLVV